MLKPSEINPGGVQGADHAPDPGSEEFKALRKAVGAASAGRSPLQRVEDVLLGVRFQMEDYLARPVEGQTVPAGHFLRECLRAVGIKNKDFAQYIGYEESNLSALFSGRRKINFDLALKLEKIFGIGAMLWLQVQNRHELVKLGKKQKAAHLRYSLEELMAKAS